MGERILHRKTTCQGCNQPREIVWDGAFFAGRWGYLCEDCGGKDGPGHTKLVYRPKPEQQSKVVDGIEASMPEEIVDGDREIECPECGNYHRVEPDADYTYTCQGCGVRVRVMLPYFM
jgi:hypothetical protein